jgi:hypothetical protein
VRGRPAVQECRRDACRRNRQRNPALRTLMREDGVLYKGLPSAARPVKEEEAAVASVDGARDGFEDELLRRVHCRPVLYCARSEATEIERALLTY